MRKIDDLRYRIANGGGLNADASVSLAVSLQEEIKLIKVKKSTLTAEYERLCEEYKRQMAEISIVSTKIIQKKKEFTKQRNINLKQRIQALTEVASESIERVNNYSM